MTDFRNDQWFEYNPSSYKQQKIVNPNTGQSPNNARFAVWHFSKLYTLRRYENPPRWEGDGQNRDGRGRRGEPTLLPFLANVQPLSRATEREYVLDQLREADRQRALIYVTFDPFITNDQNPIYVGDEPGAPMYQDGIFIRLGDARAKIGESTGNTYPPNDLEPGHANSDILEYDGLLWEAISTDRNNGGDEDLHSYVGRIGHVIMGLWEDEAQERHSSLTNREVFTGTEQPDPEV